MQQQLAKKGYIYYLKAIEIAYISNTTKMKKFITAKPNKRRVTVKEKYRVTYGFDINKHILTFKINIPSSCT